MAKANKHLTHVEDRILIDGKKGAEEAIKILKEMGKFLSGTPGPGVAVTTKWDGAPAVVCGTDPADGKFFVGTKSVFAQSPKLCKTDADIDQWYNGELNSKLKASLKYLPQANIRGVLQGDLMFTNDKVYEKIKGKRYITFRPNTITYAADPNTPLGKKIAKAQIGIVFHTKYTGTDLSNMQASFRISNNDFKTGGNIWAEKAEFKDVSGIANLNNPERQKYESCIKMAEGSIKQTGKVLDKIQTGKKTLEMDTEFLKFFNNYVKEGKNVPSVKRGYDDFLIHMGKEYNKVVVKHKTLKAQERKVTKFIEMLAFAEDNERELKMLIATYMNLQAAKQILVNKMKKVSDLKLFVNMGDYYEATTPEGFVALVDGEATKLVDRMEFSKLNFTVPKKWD